MYQGYDLGYVYTIPHRVLWQHKKLSRTVWVEIAQNWKKIGSLSNNNSDGYENVT